MKSLKNIKTSWTIILTLGAIIPGFAQQSEPVSLQKAIDLALTNNQLINIRKMQIEEKQAKVAEDKIRKYPAVSLSSTYQYSQNLGKLVVPQGSFGSLPLSPENTIALPGEEKVFELGKHNNFNAGISVYQPLSQLDKIKTGVAVSETEVNIAGQEKVKVSLQIRQAVERLYYGLLINQKQKEEALSKIELSKLRIYDVESALLSGKTINISKAGLLASIADEEQNLLKLSIQAEDYTEDLKLLTGIKANELILEPVSLNSDQYLPAETYKSMAASHNPELKIASLTQTKAEYGIKAARLSNRPDFGLIAGYSFQTGNNLFPAHNPFIGASLKWNIQDIFSNKEVLKQRQLNLQQARENADYTKDQVNSSIDKTYRKLAHATELISVAQKALDYRKEELKLQNDKKEAGLNIETDILNTKALIAKAESDLLSAQLNFRLSLSDLKMLTGE
ncbi:TolC family protein [Emticicia sp. CRIBPO]|uniref:TolC family protein n=1 Tax=Emticicia sp. CRIBPO TaxID=2683258 RepID=UPI0014135060|nr:TolC family protein [Emticicia sp. CRIBPO]NBA84672.1 TolC family protein [Emticicia sp. CRIBPO]